MDSQKPIQYDCEPGRGWISPGNPLHIDHEEIKEKAKEKEKK